MKRIIHINQHTIRRNRKSGTREHPISLKTYRDNRYGSEVSISGPAKVVYRPDKPLPCGATVWIETNSDCVIDHEHK